MKFLPVSVFAGQVPKVWKRFLRIGSLEITEYNEEEKRAIARIKDYKIHPDMAEYVLSSDNVNVEITKNVHKGDAYYEFLIKWE